LKQDETAQSEGASGFSGVHHLILPNGQKGIFLWLLLQKGSMLCTQRLG